MGMSGALILVLTVEAVIATETDVPQKVCVGLMSDEQQQDFGCIHCNSATCIAINTNDSTHVQFVSETFVLEDILHISNRENIRLESTAKPGTRILCKERIREPWKEIGFKFTNIQNLTIASITVDNCGVLSEKSLLTRRTFYSAIFLIRCTHVHISGVRILQSVGSGLAIIDTNGTVSVRESLFENNGIGDSTEIVVAGGLHIQLTSCLSNTQNSICSQKWSLNTTYIITDCNFMGNNANLPESDITLNDHEKRLLGRGGGLGIIMSDGAANNRITLTGCQFVNNTATWGGGMHVQFRGSSQNNLLVVRNCSFEDNHCPDKAGGAVNVVHDNISPEGDQMIFNDTFFVDNSAGFGGGVGVYTSPNIEASTSSITFTFQNCFWRLNKAYFSSALDVICETHRTSPCGLQSEVILSTCTFTNNTVVHGPITSQQYVEGRGTVVSTAHSIHFEGKTTFSGNNGTALYLVTSTAIFAPDSIALFERNFGYKGGAIVLIGLAAIHVQQDSLFTFRNNCAQISGGAIYYNSVDQHEYFSGSSSCFIRYMGSEDKKNISFVFDGNQAEQLYGLDIRATTLNHCRSMCHTESNDPVEIFDCIGQFNFTTEASVSTSGGHYTVNTTKIHVPLLVIPGKEFQIPFELTDDLNQLTRGSYSVQVKNYKGSNIVVDPAYTFIVNDHMKLYGQPGDRAKLRLTLTGRRPITLVFKVELDYCPPGFDIHYITMSNRNLPLCACTVNTDDRYQGMVRCNGTHFYAYVKRGYWFGYESGGTLYTSHCPAGFCFNGRNVNCNREHETHCLPAEASQEKLDNKVCGPTRTGIVCGKCVSNHSVYYHSYDLLCGSDDMCSVGWVLYIISELLPLTILFLVVIYFDISFTSGAISGFIFFAQVTDSLAINSQGSILLKPVIHELTLAYRFIYRFFNFDFFSNKVFSFCLIKGATALDALAFKYVTVLYAFIMILVVIFILKYCNLHFYRKYSCLLKHTVRNSIIHGLSAFLIMCYTQCLRVSFLLITPINIHSRGVVKVRNVVFRNGEIDYFSKAHLPYALPALACLLTFGIIPPVLLIIYPLHYRVLAALRLDEKQWFLKITKYISLEKMKPLLDSFQSCFKDNCRFFAGLYFFYRLLLLLLFAVTPSYIVFYAVVEIQLIITLAVHAYVRPYQRQLHNVTDTLIFTNLAVINAITLLNYSIVSRTGEHVASVNFFSSIQLILVFLPLCSLVGYAVYKTILKVKAMCMMRRKNSKTDEEEEEEEEQKVENEVDELEMPARLIYEDETSSSVESTDYRFYEDM